MATLRMAHKHYKISLELGREIRARYANGESAPKLARYYGLSNNSVYRILHLQCYAYTVRVAVSDEEWDWLYEQSEAQDVSVQQYVRRMVKQAMRA